MSNQGLLDTIEAIAIIGMDGRFPGARNLDEFWRNLREGVESISFFSDADLDHLGLTPDLRNNPNYVRARAVLDDVDQFDASFFGFNPREAEIIDPQQRLFLQTAYRALEDAGYDSETYSGLIGVYAGASMSSYLFNLYSNPDLIALMGTFQTMIGNDKDHLPTRVSYKLNLKGPSVTVQTACSTSLVAVHLACQSLLNYQCDMALAGGSSVALPQTAGYLYEEGGINSPDGHCRAYDAKGQGTVGGSGVGVVVLKRMTDALSDRDHIYAIIRGSAINNDGSVKVGYTAPSVEGQSAVIAMAQSVAGVEPETVSYVEGHGTATALGDPIEIAALTRAFRSRTSKKNFCAVGSVKTNIGHLDAAAGVSGLIKTVLALKNRQIPPSLHFQEPNPNIDFASSPFFISDKLAKWEANGTPRRAGVNSFGIGGTNAHVVLEEAPAAEPAQESRSCQLLLLSAKSDTALEAATANLADFLKGNRDANLADVAYTLQVGRRRLGRRRMVVAGDLKNAVEALAGESKQRSFTSAGEVRNRPVVFMFSGQGSQYPNMGLDLYENESIFREHIDYCAEHLLPHLGLDLRTLLYPAPEKLDEARKLLDQTLFTQPALFVVEYALARLWMEWGINPQAMIGHSIGEYVAACVSGVLSLEDALGIVAVRGKAMQALPSGAMLSVSLSEEALSEWVNGDLSLAAINAPSVCVVSGETGPISALESRLGGAGINCSRLHTSSAFHSRMMEPILEGFAERMSRVNFRKPLVPYISNLSGTWITENQATDANYWTQHLRETVRFADGVESILTEEDVILLEVGPGHTLSSLARLSASSTGDQLLLSSLRHPHAADSDTEFLLRSLGRLWLAGVDVNWAGFYRDEHRYRVALPSYSFDGQRYWAEPRRVRFDTEAATELPISRPEDQGNGGSPQTTARALQHSFGRSKHDRPQLASEYVEPRSEVEWSIAGLWEDMLGIAPVGVFDDFLELGGHSLLAAQVVARIRQSFQIDLPLRSLFETPTVAGLAEAVAKEKAGREGPPLVEVQLPAVVADPAHRYEPFPLTDVQHAYWIGRSGVFELGDVATHTYMESDRNGVDLHRFNLALQRLIERHDMLRAIILPDGQQQILKDVPPYEVRVLDLRGRDDAQVNAELSLIREQMSHQVLRADRWPIFDIRASLLDEGRTRFHFSFDALIGDALSMMILGREFFAFYQDPDAMLPELEITFRDYLLSDIALRETELYARARKYWSDRIPNLPPAPELPLANNPASVSNHQFARRTARLEREKWLRLKVRAAQAGLTPSGILLAAYSEILARWSKNPRFIINLTLFNRLPMHPQVNQVVGDFTSLSLLEVDNSGEDTFEARAQRIQARLWDDLDNRYVSGVQVLREMARMRGELGRATMPVVFTSTLNLNSMGDGADEPAEDYPDDDDDSQYGISQTPQVWLDHQVQDRGRCLMLNWDAVETLFPEGMLDEMFEAYCGFVRRLADDEEAWHERSRRLLPEWQLEQRAAINTTPAPISDELLHTLFAAQAASRPEQVAVVSSTRRLTYDELLRRSNQIGRKLRQMGARPNALVAVVMEKGWEQAVAVLAIQASGAAYLPISPKLPKERLDYLLQNAGTQLAVTQAWLDETIEWPDRVQRICIEDRPPSDLDDGPLEVVQRPDDLAYVIYTSGSTGLPKGVAIDHRGAVNTILDINSRFGVGPDDRVLALSSLSFDLSVYDVFGILAAGGTIVFPMSLPLPDPAQWIELVEHERVTIWNSVPALMELFIDEAQGSSSVLAGSIRLVMLSGDWVPLNLPGKIRETIPSAELISLGGATEASIWSILYPIGEVDPAWRSVPYGRPMLNQTFHVLNDALEPCPTWVPGQLFIGGIGLAKGYWGDEQKTQASFIIHPRTGERLYRTGDLGRYLPDGNIEFLGREDFQVKIQGHRIELGEIETAVAQHVSVRDVVVAPVGEERGKKRLLACVVLKQDATTTVGELRDFARSKLPDYMVPASFMVFDSLPLTPNGKVDRRAIAAHEMSAAGRSDDFVEPETQVEMALAEIWSSVLKVDRIGAGDNFFELGGDSLMATKLFGLIQKVFEVRLSVRQLLEEPTIAGMAAVIEETIIEELASAPDPGP